MATDTTNQKPKESARRRRLRLAAKILRGTALWTLRVFLLLLLALAFLVAYLHFAGVPRAALDSLEDAARAAGYPFHIRELRLTGGHGFLARGVELDLEEGTAAPFAQISEAVLWANPFSGFSGHGWMPTCEIRGGRLRATLGGADDAPARDVAIDAIDARATLDLAGDALRLRDFSATAYGMEFQGRGEITRLSALSDPDAPPRETGALDLLRDALAQAPPAATEALEQLHRLEFNAPPQIRIYFAVDASAPLDASAEIRLEAPGGGRLGEWDFSRFSVRGRWANAVLDIRDLDLDTGGDSLAGYARWDLSSGLAQGEVHSTLSPADVLPLLPDDVQETLSQAIAPLDFPVALDASAGPVAIEELPSKFQANLHIGNTAVWDIPLHGLDVRLARNGPDWTVSKLLLRVKNGRRIESLSAEDARFSETDTAFFARLDGKWTPTILLKLPWFAKGTLPEDILSRFEFDTPVSCRGAIRGTIQPLDWRLAGRVAAKNASLHGECVDSVEGAVTVTPEELRVTSILMERPEGTARGEVAVSFPDEMVHIDVDTTFAPRAICKLLGPFVENFAAPFAMEGPCRSQLRGAVDFHNFTLTCLDGHADGDLLGFGPFVTDHASADVAIRGRRITVSNAQATLWDGSVSGDFTLYPIPSSGIWHFETDAAGQKVQLAKFLANTLENANSDIRGDLYFDGHLSGDLSPAWADSLVGEADVRVEKGLLLQMRLLSGLTFFLKIILPGIDLFSQTDAGGNFRVRDGVVRTDNAAISGALFGVRGEGSYRLDNHLDFEVEVKLLHRGFIASIVQFITSPLTRLLKFRLEGSLQDPSWSPVNLNPMRFVRWVSSGDSDTKRPAPPAAPLPVPDEVPAEAPAEP